MATDRRAPRLRRGQALVELAAGLFALALVTSSLCVFADYIAKSLRAQNTLRGGLGGGAKADRVEVGAFAARNLFGVETLKIEEKTAMPQTWLLP